ncbi:hypothetical protein ACFXAE_30080 [Streptomyces sp. NPDC059454]|uniref:hypothetical protein n=1 Tax=Streptomyces sp. NPDC059454 TaxID=3346836 RepID=UPI0036B6488A
MAENYPLVEQREYRRPEKRVGWLNKRSVRDEDELPLIAAHQVRVFRVGEDYVEDPGHLRPDDPLVTGASSVTVVDRRVEVPAVVETRIPSAEAGDFTVRTTFYCTVTDACAVVRDGVTDIEALLLGHLREVPGLTEDGSDLPIVDSDAVRERIDARLTAYHEMRPATLSGLRVRHGLVEVLTPAELAEDIAKLQEERRQRERDRVRQEWEQETALKRSLLETELELKREELRSTSALHRERNRQDEALEAEFGRQKLEKLLSRFRHESGADDQRHELTQQSERDRFNREQLREDVQLIGSDPILADLQAWRQGDITADELSQRLHADEERRAGLTDRRRRAALEDELTRRGFDRDEARWRVEQDDRRKALERQVELEEAAALQREESRRWNLEHEDGVRARDEVRQDAQQRERDRQEQRREELAAWTTLTTKAFDRGLFDGQLTDPGTHINRVRDISRDQDRQTPDHGPGREVPGASTRSIPQGETTFDADDADLDLGGTDSEANLGH